MKKALFFAVSLLSFFGAKAQLDDLIIVEYVDWDSGSGYIIKVCNYTGSSINLSNYRLKEFNNGDGTSAQLDESLSGQLNNGACIRIGNPAILTHCAVDFTLTTTNGVNGDDAVVITDQSGNYIDMINGPGFWTNQRIQGNSNALKHNVVVRDPTNCNRYTNTSGSGPNSWPLNNNNNVPGWTVSTVQCLSSSNFTFTQPTRNQNLTICQGDSVMINGSWRKNSGTFQTTVSSPTGCDTIKNINLSVLQSSQTTLNEELCAGESFTFNGKNYTSIGTYRDTMPKLSNGCDSIFIINISQKPYKTKFDTVSICSGSSYAFDGKNLTVAGDYKDTIVIPNDCDSIINLRLNVTQLAERKDTVTLCFGESYNFFGVLLNNSGDYRDTLEITNQCDTAVLLNLQIRPKNEFNKSETICEGEVIQLGGKPVSTAGVYRDTLIDQNGCDSIIVTTLTVNQKLTKTENYEICEGETSLIRNVVVSSDTTFSIQKTNPNKCDSLITIQVSVSKVVADFTFQYSDLTVHFTSLDNGLGSNKWYFAQLDSSNLRNPSFTFPSEGSFPVELKVENSMGCQDAITKLVDIYPAPDQLLFIPNAFTPNSDGINDFFLVKHSEYFPFEITIFNRWGELIFQSTDLDFRWDGKYNGEIVPAGSYYYIVTGKYVRKGALTVIR